jgi:HD-GYP domain-containing protein (c-di-GMP phosphodiesterase class II)
MKIDTRIIKSKLGRRILFMFGLCALLPITALAVSSYFQVSKQLEKQEYRRLNREAKSHGLTIYERLIFLESELGIIATLIKNKSNNFTLPISIEDAQIRSQRFQVLSIITETLDSDAHQEGIYQLLEELTAQEKVHLRKERVIVKPDLKSGGTPNVLMIRLMSEAQGTAKYLVGQIDAGYLWGGVGGTAVSAFTDIIVLDEATNQIYCSAESPRTIPLELRARMLQKSFGGLKMTFEGERYLGAYRLIFMQAQFLVRGWHVVLLQPRSHVFKVMATFRNTFPIVVFVSLLLVFLLSILYIRKSMDPLDLLKKGMLGIAKRDFNQRINLTSNDELQELAQHFNQMSGQLKQQFNALNTRAEIDRTILSSFEAKSIIETAARGMQRLFSCDLLAINILDKKDRIAETYQVFKTSQGVEKHNITFTEKELEGLSNLQSHLLLTNEENKPGFLRDYQQIGLERFLILPILLEQILAAVVVLASKNRFSFSEREIVGARQMADQIGVALANSNLMRDLNMFGWGTMQAFARAVDAKSPWTAGHSERVARLAVLIGNRIGLDTKAGENLRRAAFLHDIGKIGISSSILDKEGKLTEEEFGLIKTHPDLGARIIEPIPVFAPMIPMIRQHHEKYAGGGYPEGVTKEQIDLGARILAVADVYDALATDRPYRKAMSTQESLKIMQAESGKAFDPDVLEVFMEVLEINKDLTESYINLQGPMKPAIRPVA